MTKAKTVYRISLDNGRYDHVVGKRAAYARAAEMVGYGTTAEQIASDPAEWGVRIARVSPAMARSVGL